MTYITIIINNIIIALTAHGGGAAFLPLFLDQYKNQVDPTVLEQMIYVVTALPGPISVELSGMIGYYLTGSIFGMIVAITSYIIIPVLITYFLSDKLLSASKKSSYNFFSNNVMAIIFAGLLLLIVNMYLKVYIKFDILTGILITVLAILNYFQIKNKNKNQYILLLNLILVSGFILLKGTL
jgi:chromate transport protein ChrA